MIDFDLCKKILLNGGVIACPTDTVYGLFADASNDLAVKRIFDIKQRNLSKKLILNSSSYDLVKKYVYFNDLSDKLVKNFWPGALSILFKLNDFGKENISKLVYSDDFNIAFRVPNNKYALKILSDMNVPLVSTSVNISGSDALNDYKSIYNSFGDKIDYIVENDDLQSDAISSTLCSVVDVNNPEILRIGKISQFDIERVLKVKVRVND